MARFEKKPFRKSGPPGKKPFGDGPRGGRGGKPRFNQRRDDDSAQPGAERLQKVMASAGVGSRRHCEELIEEGRVDVDGKKAKLGDRVDPAKQQIRVDGEALRAPRRPVYYLVNKPDGVVSTNFDPDGRTRVVDLVPQHDGEHLFTVGRLDMSSEGLILVTNDGELANQLTHPRYGVEKTYLALVAGQPTPEVYDQLRRGVHLAEGLARCAAVHVRKSLPKSTMLEIVLNEGKNREIRRILAKVGHKVLTLKRIAIGNVKLRELKIGDFRTPTHGELEALREAAFRSSRPDRRRVESESAPTDDAAAESQADEGREAAPAGDRPQRPPFDRRGANKPRGGFGGGRPAYGSRRPPEQGRESGDRPFKRRPAGAQRPQNRPQGNRPLPEAATEGAPPEQTGNRPRFAADRKPRFAKDRPPFAKDRPPFAKDRPPFAKDRPAFSKDRPKFAKDRPAYSKDRPPRSQDRPPYAADRPPYSKDRPPYAKDRPPLRRGKRPPFAQGDRPPFEQGDRPTRADGRPTGDVPAGRKAFGKKRRAKPLFPNRKKRGDGPPPTGRTIIGDDE